MIKSHLKNLVVDQSFRFIKTKIRISLKTFVFFPFGKVYRDRGGENPKMVIDTLLIIIIIYDIL